MESKEQSWSDIYRNYEFCNKMAQNIKSKCSVDIPEIMMVMGTGLTTIDQFMKVQEVIKFCDLPNFPISSADSHANKFVIGTIGTKNIIVMCGRIHFYDNNSTSQCIFPLRVMALLGVKYLLVTGAVGSLQPSYKVGDFVVITDHIYFPGFVGMCPLMGKNDTRFGSRFIPLKDCYDPIFIKHFIASADNIENLPNIRTGIYASVAGPHFETPAEVRYLRNVGCDVVGMSVAPEIVTAAHMGIKSMAVTVVTNICDDGQDISFSQQETFQLHANITSVSNNSTWFLFKIFEKFLQTFDNISP